MLANYYVKLLPVLNSSRKSLKLLTLLSNPLKHDDMVISNRNLTTSSVFYGKIPFLLSDIGEGIREVVVREWFVKVGDKVQQFDNICEVQSDKASVTITSRYDGTISKLYYNVDDTAHVGKPLVEIETEDEETNGATISVSETVPTETINPTSPTIANPRDYKKSVCIPSVRRLAKEKNINLSLISGSGKDGRILKEDLIKYLNAEPVTKSGILPKTARIKGFQKVMVKTMTKSLEIPHMLLAEEIILTNLSEMKKVLSGENLGVRLTFLPFFIKAVSNALDKYPLINATVDQQFENIIYNESHNIGVAMDTQEGLAVPVIKNVQSLSLLKIAKELERLVDSGRSGQFSPQDMSGATFTISNIGSIAGTYLKPIILPPQLGIMAIGTSRQLPRFDSKGNLISQEIITVSASADHRVIDGASLAHFVKSIKKQIENPYLIFVQS